MPLNRFISFNLWNHCLFYAKYNTRKSYTHSLCFSNKLFIRFNREKKNKKEKKEKMILDLKCNMSGDFDRERKHAQTESVLWCYKYFREKKFLHIKRTKWNNGWLNEGRRISISKNSNKDFSHSTNNNNNIYNQYVCWKFFASIETRVNSINTEKATHNKE